MEYDVIVVGGGHAGTEAAAAASRTGARVLLVTFDLVTIGAMSCNPSIGGLGKGHIVREIDALDGLMARAADASGIHYRMLNRSKGPAVHGPRVQADRRIYARWIQSALSAQPQLTVIAGDVRDLLVEGDRCIGLVLADGTSFRARSVVLATGTFLSAKLFRGDWSAAGGRVEERAATRLGEQLHDLGLPMARLKTGTPPRLDGRTINWATLVEQPSDGEPWTMAVDGRRQLPQVRCAISRTTTQTHDIIRSGLDRSPLFSGAIQGSGPRYCPSIEDKVVRFGDRDGHQIFLEPEGLSTHWVYPNGISTSLPADVQQALVASIAGLEQAQIVQHGYAVEYDHVDPRALDARLSLQAVRGLFLAGQINGTTGYEEAAGQGLVAGANAAMKALGRAPLTLARSDSYIGVMIDDLVLQGVTEPYRMLTARAEHRLRLRADNAHSRLTHLGIEAGVIGEQRAERHNRYAVSKAGLMTDLSQAVTSRAVVQRGGNVVDDGSKRSGFEWLRFPEISIHHVLPSAAAEQSLRDEIEYDAHYAPYVARIDEEVADLAANAAITLPPDLDYRSVAGLSNEMIDRLSRARPATLSEASRIRGVTPAALSVLLMVASKRKAA